LKNKLSEKIKLSKSKRSILYIGVGGLFLIALMAVIYSYILPLVGLDTHPSLKRENDFLRKRLDLVLYQYKSLNTDLDSLVKLNNELRIAVNLEPISSEEQLVGVGGNYFDNEIDFLAERSKVNVQQIFAFMDEVTRKVEFEKRHYLEISTKLMENKKLFEAIPAIKPCEGALNYHGFGPRIHPILNIKKMHEGIDIITDIGTHVYATGKGSVEFVGIKGGLGLTVEIDHGFGYRSIYAHLSKTNVRQGQKVNRGDLIAETGNSGLSSGPHLHYEVHHNGVKQNPSEFFFDNLNFFEVGSDN
jgi:murein DD-endopeptidase MepM/ murein hydrolase activator NlpD